MHEKWGKTIFCLREQKWLPLQFEWSIGHNYRQNSQMLSEVYALASGHLDFVEILFSFHFFINRLSSGKDVW